MRVKLESPVRPQPTYRVSDSHKMRQPATEIHASGLKGTREMVKLT
jgi:hypothetical protein